MRDSRHGGGGGGGMGYQGKAQHGSNRLGIR